jgi:phospholipid N-methyltransferase
MENKIQNQQSRPTNLALTGLSRDTLAVLNEDYPKVKILNQSKK